MGIDIRSSAPSIANRINYGVFHLKGGELGIPQLLVAALCSDGERGAFFDEKCPRERTNTVVENVAIRSCNAPDDHRQTRHEVGIKTGRQHFFALGEKRDTAR